MAKNFYLLLISSLFLCGKAWADAHTSEYISCMQKNSADSVLTQCQEKEYQHYLQVIDDDLSQIKNDPYFSKLLSTYSLDEQYKNWSDSTKIYCQNYVFARRNQGYSDAFSRSECLLERAESYEEWLDSIISNAHADIKG